MKGRGHTFSHEDTMVYGGCANPQLEEGIIKGVFLVGNESRVVGYGGRAAY